MDDLRRSLESIEILRDNPADVARQYISRYTPLESFIWELRQHEELMLRHVRNYKEHFVHMFKVWLMGLKLLRLGSASNGQRLGQEIIKTEGFKPLINYISEENSLNLLYGLWSLISLSHDCGRCYEDMKNWVNELVKVGLETKKERDEADKGSKEDEKVRNVAPDAALHRLLGRIRIQEQLQSVLKHIDQNPAWLMSQVYLEIAHARHGILSALVLSTSLSNAKNQVIQERKCRGTTYTQFESMVKMFFGNVPSNQRKYFWDQIVDTAVSAVALHHWPRWLHVKESKKNGQPKRIQFSQHPLLFLLTYCDMIQETGRESESARSEANREIIKEWASPLEDFDVDPRGGIIKVRSIVSMPFPFPESPQARHLMGWIRRQAGERYAFSSGERKRIEGWVKDAERKADDHVKLGNNENHQETLVRKTRADAIRKIAELWRFKLQFDCDSYSEKNLCFDLGLKVKDEKGKVLTQFAICANVNEPCREWKEMGIS